MMGVVYGSELSTDSDCGRTKGSNPLLALIFLGARNFRRELLLGWSCLKSLDRQLQDIQPALETIDGVNDLVLIDAYVID
jgi:hypothetical protein